MHHPPHVALLIETSMAYGRGLLRGVARYIHEHGPWSVYFRPQGLDEPPPVWLTRWQGDGILARINNPRMARAVLKTKLPTVDMRNALTGLHLPGIGPDNRAVVELAFRQFVESGFQHFGFCGATPGQNRFLDVRCNVFQELVSQAGHASHIHLVRPSGPGMAWEQQQNRLVRWLQKLPRPIGILTCDDDHGLQLLDACQRAGIMVPDEVAVIGINNDEHLCGLTNPPLSSVDVNPERIGYESAALLDRMMTGQNVPPTIREYPPRGLVLRQSSDTAAVADRYVAEALCFIRTNIGKPFSVLDVAQKVDISRSTLERRFMQLLGRTPKQEILRVKLNHAKELLARTDLPLSAIAERLGFQSSGYLCEVFHQHVGSTPGSYRRNFSCVKFGP